MSLARRLPLVLVFLGGCATRRVSPPLNPKLTQWPEWNSVPLTLIDSVDPDGGFIATRPPPGARLEPSAPAPAGPPAAAISSTAVPARAPAPPPQPSIEHVTAGESLKLLATADGTLPLSFQWRKNGLPLAGKTDANFHIEHVSETDGGEYDCVVSNRAGSAASAKIKLVVDAPTR